MREFLPIIIVLSIIGAFTVAFLTAYAALKKRKDPSKDRHIADGEIVRRLVKYARPYWKQFILVFLIMIVSVVYDVVAPLLIGHIQGVIKGKKPVADGAKRKGGGGEDLAEACSVKIGVKVNVGRVELPLLVAVSYEQNI